MSGCARAAAELASLPKPVRMCPSTRKYIKSLERRAKPKVYGKASQEKLQYWTDFIHSKPKMLFFGFSGMASLEMKELRYNLKEHNLTIWKVRTPPTRLAMSKSPLHAHKGLHHQLKNQICVAYTDELEINMKAIVKIIKASPNATLHGGIVDYQAMLPEDIDEYMKLPSLQKSREELVGLLSQPSQTLLRLLQTNQTNLSQSLSLYIQQNEPKTESEETGGEDDA